MKSKKLQSFFKDNFIFFTSLYSVLIAVLYLWRGFSESFIIYDWFLIAMNLLYVPFAIIFNKKGFSYFHLVYAILLTFIISLEKTYLFNNYTALFLICIVFMIQPKLEYVAIISYFVAACIAFIINEENLIQFFIHIIRSIWFIQIVSYVLKNQFERKRLVLYEDEKRILDQLCEGKVYQKEVEGFSENTIYRKLKAARERNGNITRDQLVELYRKEKEKEAENN